MKSENYWNEHDLRRWGGVTCHIHERETEIEWKCKFLFMLIQGYVQYVRVLSDRRHLDYFRGLFLASHVFCLPILYARPREVELWHWFCTVQGCLYLWQIVLSGALKWQIKLQGHRHKSIAGFRRKSCRWKIAHCLLEGILAVEEHRARKLDTWHLKAKNLIFADSPFVSP